MHYHIIPAPKLGGSEQKPKSMADLALPTHSEMHQKEFEARQELDDDDAVVLVKGIRVRL